MKHEVLAVPVKNNCVGILNCLKRFLPSAWTVAETTEETNSEWPVSHQQACVCGRLYPAQRTSPSVSFLILRVTEG